MQLLVDYQGRTIRLTPERLAHILERPEMRAMEPAIAWTLRIPDRVIRSPSDADVHMYYRYHPVTPIGGKQLCVVVKRPADDAFVLTAYLTNSAQKGAQIWPIAE